jgi:hypothetical protein
MTRSLEALRAAARRRTEQAEQAVTRAVRTARRSGEPVSITGLAAAAGVSPDFIYNHPGLRAQAEALRGNRRPVPGNPGQPCADADAAAGNLVRALQQQLAQQRRAHREETAELKAALAAALGENLALRRRAAEPGKA